jgi:hypothetical protein
MSASASATGSEARGQGGSQSPKLVLYAGKCASAGKVRPVARTFPDRPTDVIDLELGRRCILVTRPWLSARCLLLAHHDAAFANTRAMRLRQSAP